MADIFKLQGSIEVNTGRAEASLKKSRIRLHLPNGAACLFCGVAMPDGDSPVWFERCAVRENVATASLSDVCRHKEIESLFGQQTAAAYLLTGRLR